MIRESLFFGLLIAALATHCGSDQPPHLIGEDAVAEAIFSYQMQQKPLQRNEEIYFLQIEKKQDPTADLLKRLTDKKHPVEVGSKSAMVQGRIQDKDTKKIGVLLEIRNRTCTSENQCEVESNIRWGSDSAEGWRYELTKENNQWVVKKAELTSIT